MQTHSHSLFGVELDDGLLIDRNVNFLTMGETCDGARQICLIGSQPCGSGKGVAALLELLEERAGAALLCNLDHVALTNECGRNVNALAVHSEMSVTDELTCLAPRVGKAETEDNIVEAALEKAFQQGGETLRQLGIRYEALATVESLDNCEIKLR